MKTLRTIIASISIALLLIAPGCSDAAEFFNQDLSEDLVTMTSYEMNIPIEKVRTLNPVISKDEDTYYLSKLIYEGLFALQEDLTPVSVLASGYDYAEDGLSVTISLKEDVAWQDDLPFVAEDVKFSIEAYQIAAAGGQTIYSSYVEGIKNVKVTDIRTFIIYTKYPFSVTMEQLTFPILPKHTFEKATDLVKATENFIPIGTGPYSIEISEDTDKYILNGNKNYRGDVPKNQLIARVLPGTEVSVNLFDTGEIDMAFLKSVGRKMFLDNDEDIIVTSFPSNEAEVIGFNFMQPAMQNQKVRQAIAYAIDNQAIIESCYYSNGTLNDSVFYPGFLGIESKRDAYPYDPDIAIKILQNAKAEGLPIRFLVNAEDSARLLASKMIKTSLERIGMNVTLIEANWEEYNAILTDGNYDIYLGGFRFQDTYDLRPILHSLGSNPIHYENPSLDHLLDQMQTAIIEETRVSMFRSVKATLVTEIPYYCVLYKTYGIAMPSYVEGKVTPSFNNIYKGCESWRIIKQQSQIIQ